MNKFETYGAVVGSSALKDDAATYIIEFPQAQNPNPEFSPRFKKLQNGVRTRFQALLLNPSIQSILRGNLRGSSINKAKPWQSFAVGSFFFVFALACVYFGR